MMRKNSWTLLISLGLLLAVLLACKSSFTTAHISSLKITSDEAGNTEAKTFKPGEKVFAVAQVSNNISKVQVKFRVLYDDVEGETAGTMLPGAEKTLDVEGSRAATFWLTLPPGGFHNGRYKIEVTMTSNGEQKDQKSATFEITGYE